jgi:hypothetical protein
MGASNLQLGDSHCNVYVLFSNVVPLPVLNGSHNKIIITMLPPVAPKSGYVFILGIQDLNQMLNVKM